MIKSGLVNQKRGGGFEQGYPSQKYPKGRDEFIRPYVNNSDPTVLRKSEYSDPMAYKAVTPSPIQYNDIFRKKPTPDERLYILKQIQQGLDKVQKGILGKIPGGPVVAVPSATAPSATRPTDEVGQTIGAPPAGPPGGGDGGGILVDDTPDMTAESPVSSVGATFPEGGDGTAVQFDPTQQDGTDEIQNAQFEAELEAVQVVTPATVDPVREDVVTGSRDIIADTMPGAFPAENPAEEVKEEEVQLSNEEQAIENGEIRSKPPSWYQTSLSEKQRKVNWRNHYDRNQKEKAKYGKKPEMSSAKSPSKLPPSLGRRPSK